jgi:hypothetical protein
MMMTGKKITFFKRKKIMKLNLKITKKQMKMKNNKKKNFKSIQVNVTNS